MAVSHQRGTPLGQAKIDGWGGLYGAGGADGDR